MSKTPWSEDISWETLAAFLAGELPDADLPLVDQWRAADPRHEELLTVLRQGWQASGDRRRYDAEAALRWIKGHAQDPVEVEAPPGRQAVASLRRYPEVRRALLAASVAAVAVGGWWFLAGEPSFDIGAGRTSGAAFTEYRAARGHRQTLKLADGTSVILGPESRLRVASGYGRSSRAVELEGDGYFEVRHDARRPFSVRTRNALIRDLGTRFVVQAYPDDSVTDVVVAEGRVAMGRAGGHGPVLPIFDERLTLGPGQHGRLTEAGALIQAPDDTADDYLGWVAGRLVIPGLPVVEALRRIGRWYDVKVRLAGPGTAAELSGRTVTAVFRDETAAEAVRLIAAPFDLAVERDSAGFVLRAMGRSR